MKIFSDLIKINKHQMKESGQSLIELAASMVVLLILLSGIVDFGRAIFIQFSLQDAAEEGIVYGIGFPTDCDQIVQRVRSNLSNRVIPADLIVRVYIEGTTCFTADPKQVYAGQTMDIVLIMPFTISMPFLAGETIELKGEAKGIILRPQPLE